jgi:hypothetical protein
VTEMTESERLGDVRLHIGSHEPDSGRMCLMEAAAALAGEEHSDEPLCVSRFLADYGRLVNDSLYMAERQQLVALIPALLGTADDDLDGAREFVALDWLVHTWAPTWLDTWPPSAQHAEWLRDLPVIVDEDAWQEAYTALREILDEQYWASERGPRSDVVRLLDRSHKNGRPEAIQFWAGTANLARQALMWPERYFSVTAVMDVAHFAAARAPEPVFQAAIRELRRASIPHFADLIKVPEPFVPVPEVEAGFEVGQ